MKAWAEFIFALAVRFLVGAVIALAICLALTFFAGSRGPRKSVLVESVNAGATGFLFWWFAAWAVIGGLMAAFSIPRWQTPWYKYKRWEKDGDNDIYIA